MYQERLARVFYENYLGSIVDWYMATLVRKEPVVEFEGAGDSALDFAGRLIPCEPLRALLDSGSAH